MVLNWRTKNTQYRYHTGIEFQCLEINARQYSEEPANNTLGNAKAQKKRAENALKYNVMQECPRTPWTTFECIDSTEMQWKPLKFS